MTLVICRQRVHCAAKRHIFFAAALAVFCVMQRISPAAPANSGANRGTANPSVDLREHPTRGKTPVDVSVGLYLMNLVAVDETRETFEIAGYLAAKWRDPRLVLPANPGQTTAITGRGHENFALRTSGLRRLRPQTPFRINRTHMSWRLTETAL